MSEGPLTHGMYRLLIGMYPLTLLRSTGSLGAKDRYIGGAEVQTPGTVARDYATNLALTTVPAPLFFRLSYREFQNGNRPTHPVKMTGCVPHWEAPAVARGTHRTGRSTSPRPQSARSPVGTPRRSQNQQASSRPPEDTPQRPVPPSKNCNKTHHHSSATCSIPHKS